MADEEKTEHRCTRDAVYRGRLLLDQPSKGYRFSIDSLLLTAFACTKRRASLTADLGAGCGVIGLGLLAAHETRRVVAVEVQSGLAELALGNASLNGFESCYQVVQSDVCAKREELPHSEFELVVTNPPFWPRRAGRLPLDEERRLACHEILCGIDEWMKSAGRLLHPSRGRLVVVFPARRLDELIVAMGGAQLFGSTLRFVHPLADKPAELVLVEARGGTPGRLVTEPPLVLKNSDGSDTPEAASIVNGAFSANISVLPDRRAHD